MSFLPMSMCQYGEFFVFVFPQLTLLIFFDNLLLFIFITPFHSAPPTHHTPSPSHRHSVEKDGHPLHQIRTPWHHSRCPHHMILPQRSPSQTWAVSSSSPSSLNWGLFDARPSNSAATSADESCSPPLSSLWVGEEGGASTPCSEAAFRPRPLAFLDPCPAFCIGDMQHIHWQYIDEKGEYVHVHTSSSSIRHHYHFSFS